MNYSKLSNKKQLKIAKKMYAPEVVMTVDKFRKVLTKRIHDLCKERNIRVLEEMCHRAGITIRSRKRKNLVKAITDHQVITLKATIARERDASETIWACTQCDWAISEIEKDRFLFDYMCSNCGRVKVSKYKKVKK